jgi:hypothetical protein
MNKELQNEIINYKRKIYNKKGWPTLNNDLKNQIEYFVPFDAEFKIANTLYQQKK